MNEELKALLAARAGFLRDESRQLLQEQDALLPDTPEGMAALEAFAQKLSQDRAQHLQGYATEILDRQNDAQIRPPRDEVTNGQGLARGVTQELPEMRIGQDELATDIGTLPEMDIREALLSQGDTRTAADRAVANKVKGTPSPRGPLGASASGAGIPKTRQEAGGNIRQPRGILSDDERRRRMGQ